MKSCATGLIVRFFNVTVPTCTTGSASRPAEPSSAATAWPYRQGPIRGRATPEITCQGRRAAWSDDARAASGRSAIFTDAPGRGAGGAVCGPRQGTRKQTVRLNHCAFGPRKPGKSNAAELAQRDGVWLSATKSRLKMATQIVIDYTGDTAHQFDPADAAAVAETERRLKKLTASLPPSG
jgi:hypothetical protein